MFIRHNESATGEGMRLILIIHLLYVVIVALIQFCDRQQETYTHSKAEQVASLYFEDIKI